MLEQRWFLLAFTLLVPIVGTAQQNGAGEPGGVDAIARDAQTALSREDWSAAIRGYEKLIKLAPTRADFQLNLGVARYFSGKANDAVPAFRQALKLKPDLLAAQDYLSVSLAESGQCREALPRLKKAGRMLSADGDGSGAGRLVGALLTQDESTGAFRLSEPFDLGRQGTWTARAPGQLYVRCRDAWHELADNEGSITLTLPQTAAASAPSTAKKQPKATKPSTTISANKPPAEDQAASKLRVAKPEYRRDDDQGDACP